MGRFETCPYLVLQGVVDVNWEHVFFLEGVAGGPKGRFETCPYTARMVKANWDHNSIDSAAPPVAERRTTSQGGHFQKARRPKAAAPSARSSREVMAVVQTGS